MSTQAAQHFNPSVKKLYVVYLVVTLLLGALLGLDHRHAQAITQAQTADQPGDEFGLALSDAAPRPAGAPAGPVVVAIQPDSDLFNRRALLKGDVVTGFYVSNVMNPISPKKQAAGNAAHVVDALKFRRDHKYDTLNLIVWRNGQMVTTSW